MKGRLFLIMTVCVVCALSFGLPCYAQTNEVSKSRPAWIDMGHYSLENTYLDVIMQPGKLEELSLLRDRAEKTAIDMRKSTVGNNEAWVKTQQIGKPYYSEQEGVAYFLFQTGESPDKSHKTWEKIQVTDKYPFSAVSGRVFVPGMAQIYKGSTGKGIAFITGEVLFVGGIITTEFMRRNYSIKINQTNNTRIKEHYAHNANICAISRNACIGGAVALYVWNIIDGIVAKGKPNAFKDGKLLTFVPYMSYDATGIAMNLKF